MIPAQPITRCDKCRYIRYTGHTFSAPVDWGIVRYAWTETNGQDLDTRTAITNTGNISVDNLDVGWGTDPIGTTNSRIVVPGIDPEYLTWGGDNVANFGHESVLINFKQIALDFPLLTDILFRFRTYWYQVKADGKFTLQFQTFLGGTMVPFTTSTGQIDWNNVGGTVGDNIIIPRLSSTYSNQTSVAGDEEGFLSYHIPSKIPVYMPPTFHILTEDGNNIITEDGNRIVTEDAL